MIIQGVKLLDYRHKMKRASWSIGTRPGKPLEICAHYNGPAVAGAGDVSKEIAQLQFDSAWHMRPGAFGVKNGGDGIMYHGATLSNGQNVLLRDLSAILWHCGNAFGNKWAISWHFPLGSNQAPTAAQWEGFLHIVAAFRAEYQIAPPRVKGHREYSDTACPGTPIYTRLVSWRRWAMQQVVPGFPYYRATTNLRVRTAPSANAPMAVRDGHEYIMPAGTVFAVDEIKMVDGVPWLHHADHYGFSSGVFAERI